MTVASVRYRLTRISDLDANASSLEIYSIQSQGLLQTLDILKLGVGESLGTCQLTVFNDPDIHHLASLKKLGDSFLRSIV